MNYVQGTGKPLGFGAALTLAMIALAAAGTAIPAQAQTYNVTYDFQGNSANGLPSEPAGLVAQGQDGNLYGYSSAGGTSTACKLGCGTIYEMNLTSGPPPTVLYNFPTYDDCGLGLTLGTDGNFYGVCTKGNGSGGKGHGYVFQFVPATGAFTPYSFSHAGIPSSRPIEATPGTFYGTTITGGYRYGTVYQITPPGLPTTVYSFTTEVSVNYTYPNGPLFLGTDGNLYGTTQAGTDSAPPFPKCPPDCGAVYSITTAGTNFTPLYTFTGAPSDGATPTRGVIEGSDLNFYGTTVQGGVDNLGTIFQWDPTTGGITYLYNFTTTGYGHPRGLAEGGDFNFYGPANGCSTKPPKSCLDDGTLFEVSPTVEFSPVVEFTGKGGDYPGAFPDSTLSHTNGTLYGVTGNGGEYNDGVFYSLTPSEAPVDEETEFCRPQIGIGQEGSKAYILGQNFSSSSQVYFGNDSNPVTPNYVNETGTFLTVTIPAGAQSGTVEVTTPGFNPPALYSLLPFQVQE